MTVQEKRTLLNRSDAEILGYVKGCPDDTKNKICSPTSDCIKCIKRFLKKDIL